MTIKEKMMAVYRRKNEGKIPWGVYNQVYCPQGETERELRNKGLGIIVWVPAVTLIGPSGILATQGINESEIKNVEMTLKPVYENGEQILIRSYHTPLGDISEEIINLKSYHGQIVRKYFIKKPHDYKIMKFIVENNVLRNNYDAILEAQQNVGNDGIVMSWLNRSPLQKVLYEYVGPENFFIDYYDHKDLVEDLINTVTMKEFEGLQIVADSPTEVIWRPENVTEDFTEPKLFQKFNLPFFKKFGDVLHKNNKIVVTHMDGRLKHLKDLLGESNIDVIESFTIPEGGGNLSLVEAYNAWKDKAIMFNIPTFLSNKTEKETKSFMENLISTLPGKNFMMVWAEDLAPKNWIKTLSAIGDVMANQ